jgi:uncharacterized membrane protein YoaK (UPF0700 family)
MATHPPARPESPALVSIGRDIAQTLKPHPTEGLLPPLFLALTFVTGVVDATSYLSLGHVFVANMTGNVVFLGFGIAGAGGISVSASLTALASFLVGGVVGGRVANALAGDRDRHLRVAIGIQTVLVAAALVVAAAAGDDVEATARYSLIALLAAGMGIQNAAARKLAVPDLTTTVLTLTLTGVASDSRLAGGSGARIGRRGLSVVSMLLGALIGGLLVLHVDDAAPLGLAAALLLLVVLALAEPVKSRLLPPSTTATES